MKYTSALFLLLFIPCVMLFYQLLPKRMRPYLLLAASYAFFLSISGKLIFYLMLSTLSIHYIGLWLETTKKDLALKRETAEDKKAIKKLYTRKLRWILLFGVLFNIGVLVVLKYFGFFFENINKLFEAAAIPLSLTFKKAALPIGISFYTLQAVSYLVDVYYGKIEADKNIGRLALYLSFFPIIMEGPICRYSDTAEALFEGKPLQYKNITFGMQRMLWGLFKKLIIADRLNLLVTKIFDAPDNYSGAIIFFGAAAYTLQLYSDFSGCIDMTIGIGEIFGITIPENFKRPFFSRTTSEFWRRWHITLGTWFKDYVFYPLSMTKFSKKLGKKTKEKLGKHMGQIIPSSIALLAVWLCNGLWHGTGWNYIFFGVYYFVFIVLGNIFEPLIEKVAAKLKINRDSVPYRIFQTVKMLIIIVIGELFFRAKNLSTGFSMFKSIFTNFNPSTLVDGSLLKLSLRLQDFGLLLVAVVILIVVSLKHEKGLKIREKIATFKLPLRWTIYYAAIMFIIIFGAYGDGYIPAAMLYADF